MDIYEGDPQLINGYNGSYFVYRGGQPVMDRGIENSISIDLGTKKKGEYSHTSGWVGNFLIREQDQKIGTDYQKTVEEQPITLSGLAKVEQAATEALTGKLYGTIESFVSNPSSRKILNRIRVNPPSGAFDFFTETFSKLWQFQAQKDQTEDVTEIKPYLEEFQLITDDGNYQIITDDGKYIILGNNLKQ